MPAVYMMGREVWGASETQEAYLQACSQSPKYARGVWFVLEKDGVAVSSLIVYRFAPDVAGLGSIATRPEFRRQGLAAGLIDETLKMLDREGARRIYLYADIAPVYYERFGFSRLPSERQTHPGSVCMLRASSVDAGKDAPPPPYF